MKKFIPLFALALLAACQKAEEAPAPEAVATQPADVPAVEMPAEENTEENTEAKN